VVVLLLAVAVLICVGFEVGRRGQVNGPPRVPERAQAEAARRAPDVVISASRLLREFQSDPGAEKKYRGKYLEISFGVVERSGTDPDGTPFVVLTAGDERAALKIECFFDSADDEEETRLQQLPRGGMISLCGRFSDRVSHLQLRECVLIK
jgi:hypothetical protein